MTCGEAWIPDTSSCAALGRRSGMTKVKGIALLSPSSSRAKPERSGGADPGSMPRRSSKGGAVQATHRSFSIVPLDDLLRGMDPGYGVLRCAWTPFRHDEGGGDGATGRILGPSMRGSVMDGLATSVVPTVRRPGLVRRGPPLRLASLGTSPLLRGVGGWAAALGAGCPPPHAVGAEVASRSDDGGGGAAPEDAAATVTTAAEGSGAGGGTAPTGSGTGGRRRVPRPAPDRGDGWRGMDPGYVVLRCAWTSFRDCLSRTG